MAFSHINVIQTRPKRNMKTTAAVVTLLLGVAGIASAHGSHDQETMVDPADDWALYHMQEEHRM